MTATPRDVDIELLRHELRVAGVGPKLLFPRWARPRSVRRDILSELWIASHPTVHEGLVPSYGSMVVPPDVDVTAMRSLSDAELPLAREAVDGNGSVLLLRSDGYRGLLLDQASEVRDLSLARLARGFDGVGITRERNGVVRVHSARGSLEHANRRWRVVESLDDAVALIRRVAPMVSRTPLTDVLAFAFFVLSPWRIGATLVWILSDRPPEREGLALGRTLDLRGLHLSVTPAQGEPSLGFAARLLSQHDGATIVSSGGQMLMTAAQLAPSAKAKELIPELPGTRHTSARRASYDLADALIVTISADGPVTVYSDGVAIHEMGWYSAADEARAMRRAYGSTLEDALLTSSQQVVCSRCGKTSVVQELVVAGYRSAEEANCPVCGSVVAEGHCFDLRANLRKVF